MVDQKTPLLGEGAGDGAGDIPALEGLAGLHPLQVGVTSPLLWHSDAAQR